MEETALTGKLELCVGEVSAKGKPFLKELTTTNINGEKFLNGPQLVAIGSNSRKLLKSTKRRHCQPRVFSGSPDLNIPINDTNNAKHLRVLNEARICKLITGKPNTTMA